MQWMAEKCGNSPQSLLCSVALIVSIVLIAAVAAPQFLDTWQAVGQQVSFNRDIRPILNQNCVSCHGGVKQRGEVSFIYRDEALGTGKSGQAIVVPGYPDLSELMARVTSDDPEYRMPYDAPPLSERQISLLRRWIEEGAVWEDHWAFVAPSARVPPEVSWDGWVRQPIDYFILARLEEERLVPSNEADKSALLRRVSFDLTGLPPSLEDLETYLADTSPKAYEMQVDRLLASPRFGERWATMWLDLARYADSKGYSVDGTRTSWPYRDWVVQAFNDNVPYDVFVIRQIAGDLLPDATFEDRIATAFHRQTLANDEGGTDDEEFRLAAVMDRVATTWSVLNGVTMNCVQCHSHPYDPIRHEEYYNFLAFFNTSQDSDAQFDDYPVLHVPKDKSQYPQAFQLQDEIAELTEAVVNSGRQVAADADQWVQLPITRAVTKKTLGLERQWSLLMKQGQYLFSELGRSTPTYRRQLFELFFGKPEGRGSDARATAEQPVPFELRAGEAWATADNIGAGRGIRVRRSRRNSESYCAMHRAGAARSGNGTPQPGGGLQHRADRCLDHAPQWSERQDRFSELCSGSERPSGKSARAQRGEFVGRYTDRHDRRTRTAGPTRTGQ